jgi:hypothetical protein
MQFFVYSVSKYGKVIRIPSVDEHIVFSISNKQGILDCIKMVGFLRFCIAYIALRDLGFVAITLGSLIISRSALDKSMFHHELVHVFQWRVYGWGFLFLYIGSFIYNFLFGRSGVRFSFVNAYRNIRFERDAIEGSFILENGSFLSWVHVKLGIRETLLSRL